MYLYDERSLDSLMGLAAHDNGVTGLKWSPDGYFLYTGACSSCSRFLAGAIGADSMTYTTYIQSVSLNLTVQPGCVACAFGAYELWAAE